MTTAKKPKSVMVRKLKIAPSILSADFTRLAEEITALDSRLVDYIHIDVMDGHFVPNLTIGPPVIEQIKAITKIPLDVHIMISNPEATFERYVRAGADQLTAHVEACEDASRLVRQIKACGIRAGLSLKPETSLDLVKSALPFLDSVLVMTVNPGFGGQRLIAEALQNVAALAKLRSEGGFEIAVDGGVTLENIRTVWESGADVVIAGSAIYKTADYNRTIRQMRKACE